MMSLLCDVLTALKGKTLATAESCTGGGVGAALTSVAGSSSVYKGGIISYTNEIKQKILDVPEELLREKGPISAEVAASMAVGARKRLETDVAVSVTGLAGPGGDDFGNPVGTVYIGYSDEKKTISRACYFTGNREEIRNQTIAAALGVILENFK